MENYLQKLQNIRPTRTLIIKSQDLDKYKDLERLLSSHNTYINPYNKVSSVYGLNYHWENNIWFCFVYTCGYQVTYWMIESETEPTFDECFEYGMSFIHQYYYSELIDLLQDYKQLGNDLNKIDLEFIEAYIHYAQDLRYSLMELYCDSAWDTRAYNPFNTKQCNVWVTKEFNGTDRDWENFLNKIHSDSL